MNANTNSTTSNESADTSSIASNVVSTAEKLIFSRQNYYLLMAVTLCFGVFCIETDIYAPSLPDMVHFLTQQKPTSRISLLGILSVYVCRDYFTVHYQTLMVANLYYVLGYLSLQPVVFACTLVTTDDQLILWRFIQGLGCGAITSIASTMFFDAFPKNQSAQIITILNSFITGMMAAAPLIGSWINLKFGWQMNFIVVAVGAVLSFITTFFFSHRNTSCGTTSRVKFMAYPQRISSLIDESLIYG